MWYTRRTVSWAGLFLQTLDEVISAAAVAIIRRDGRCWLQREHIFDQIPDLLLTEFADVAAP